MIKRIMSSVLSIALLIGSFSNYAFAENEEEAKREQIKIYKTTEDQAFNNPKLVTTWDYDEEKNTYTENGKELSFISNDEIKFSGKTPRSGAIEAIVKKSIPVKSIIEYYENKESEKLEEDKLSVGFIAPDGFKYETEYSNLVNLEGKSDVIYIEGFGPDNYLTGIPVDAVISLDSIRGEDEDKSLPRLYKGINKGTEYESIANFGYESISNIETVILKDHYTISMVNDENKYIENIIKTDDGIYFSDDTIENEERNSFKLLNKSRNILPGEKVEIEVYNGANVVITKQKRTKKDEGSEIETVKDENGIISFTMPTSDVNIKLKKDESEENRPFAYIRMEYPELDGDTLNLKLNLREYNLTEDYSDDMKGRIEALDANLDYDNNKFEFANITESDEGKVFDMIIWDNSDKENSKDKTVSINSINFDTENIDINNITKGLIVDGKLKVKNSITEEDYKSLTISDLSMSAKGFLEVPVQIEKDFGAVNLPFDTIYEEDDSMDLGEEKVLTEGMDGIGRKIKASVYKAGEEINKNKEWIEVQKEPVNKVIKVGTKANEDNSTEEPGTNNNDSESEEPKENNDEDKPKENGKDKPKENNEDKPKENGKDKPKENDEDKPKENGKDKPKENNEDKPKENGKDKPKKNKEDELSEQYDSDIVYIDGYENGMFKPDSDMTRAEVSKVIAYALTKGLDEEKEYKSNFTDVNKEAWYAKILGYMKEIKAIDGYPDGEFRPDKPITRAEFAKIVSLIDGFKENDLDKFKDVKTNHWAKKYIEDLAKKGHIKGYPDGSYKPENNITRAEVVTIINRIIGKDKKFYENRKDLKLFKDVDKDHWAYMDIIMASNKKK